MARSRRYADVFTGGLGGATSGATIGGTVGGPVGAGVGGAIGALAGGIGGFFGSKADDAEIERQARLAGLTEQQIQEQLKLAREERRDHKYHIVAFIT